MTRGTAPRWTGRRVRVRARPRRLPGRDAALRRGFRIELLAPRRHVAGLQAANPVEAALTRGFGHVAFDVPDVDAAYDALIAAGASDRMSPRPSPEPGVRMAYVADPEGNLLELLDRSRVVLVTGRLEGKIALITGVGGGMGVAAARMFCAEGARVVGCDLDSTAPRPSSGPRRGRRDHRDERRRPGRRVAAREWVDAAVATYDGIDVLYNNASTQRFGALDELSIEDWDFTMRNELDLVYYTVRAAWPHLKRTGGGSIINVGSIAALRGVEFMPQNAHSTAKGGVIALTLQLVVEGGPHGIRANVISPGMTETPNTAPLLADPPERMKRVVLDRIPLGRHGQPEDVVNAAIFLASDESSWISGTNIVVDGGGSVLG